MPNIKDRVRRIGGGILAVAFVGLMFWFDGPIGLLRAGIGYFRHPSPEAVSTPKLAPLNSKESDVVSKIWGKALREQLSDNDIASLKDAYKSWLTRNGQEKLTKGQMAELVEITNDTYDYNYEIGRCLLYSVDSKIPNVSDTFTRLGARLVELDFMTEEKVKNDKDWIISAAEGKEWKGDIGDVHAAMTRERALNIMKGLESIKPNFDKIAEMFEQLGSNSSTTSTTSTSPASNASTSSPSSESFFTPEEEETLIKILNTMAEDWSDARLNQLRDLFRDATKRTGHSIPESEAGDIKAYLILRADFRDALDESLLTSWDKRKYVTTKRFDELYDKMLTNDERAKQEAADAKQMLNAAAGNQTSIMFSNDDRRSFGRRIILNSTAADKKFRLNVVKILGVMAEFSG